MLHFARFFSLVSQSWLLSDTESGFEKFMRDGKAGRAAGKTLIAES
jgi:hypothetical protein